MLLVVVAVGRCARRRSTSFPEFAPPLVEVQTEAPGLSTNDVEALVTVPLEAALNGIPGLDTLRSKSVLGLSSVVLILDPSTDVLRARQMVQERLSRAAATLPAVARPPVMLSPLSSLSRVMKIGMTSERLSQVEMSTLAKWTIRPRLMAIPGVANVAVWGQRDRQIQVLVDPDPPPGARRHRGRRREGDGRGRLAAAGRLPRHAEPAARDHARGGGAHGPRPGSRWWSSASNGAALRIGDVATVVEGFPPPIGDAVINDVPGLLLIVEKQLGANTLQVTRDVEAALEELQPALADVTVDPTIFRPATFIEMSLQNLSRALLIGCVLVDPRAARVPGRLAHRAHQQHRDPAVAARRRAAAALPRRHARHDGAGRASSSRSAKSSMTRSSTSRTSSDGCG